MRSYIEASDKVNEIKLLLRHPSYRDKGIVVVEGGTDVRLFRSVIRTKFLKLESVDGKDDLVKVIRALKSDGEDAVLGVADADFDHLEGQATTLEAADVYVTDVHDAELLMISSPALDAFVHEFVVDERHAEVLEALRDAVLQAAYHVGILRWINAAENLNLRFKGLRFSSFCDISKLDISINIDDLIDDVLRRSPRADKSKSARERLRTKYDEYGARDACALQVCCGHDVTRLIALIFSQRWISLEKNMSQGKVESTLRVAYSMETFRETSLYAKLSSWLEVRGQAF